LFTDASSRNAPAKDKGKFSLAIGLCAVIVLGGIAYYIQNARIEELNSELALKSNTMMEKDSQILEATATISSQSQQIEAKDAQLEQLNIEIAQIESEIEFNEQIISSQDSEIEELNQRMALQRGELQDLRLEASGLQDEIQILESKIQENEGEISRLTGQVDETEERLQSFERTRVQHFSLAIDQNANGWVLPIEVEIIPTGDGTVSIDVKNVQYETGFQTAVRNAVEVASEHSGIEVSDKDIIIRVVNEFDDPQGELTIDGGSAGALVSAMIIVGLSGEEIDSSVLVTGTIELDGTVGRIGALEEKAQAAANFGAKTLLVPEEQEFNDASIEIVGVSDIDDVLRYITQ
jgi:Lon protease-like protein